ncbi:MAG: TonB family protein [Desulfurellaceae bacterium]|nr:TonB family protein [Desulfurellaceae bacterium]
MRHRNTDALKFNPPPAYRHPLVTCLIDVALALPITLVVLAPLTSAQETQPPVFLGVLHIQGRVVGTSDCVTFRHSRARDSFCVSLHTPDSRLRKRSGQRPEAEPARPSDYPNQLLARLSQYKSYPPALRKKRQQGTVVLAFSVDRSGAVLASDVQKSSGYPLLDQAALDLLVKASPLPAMPDSMARERLYLVLPVEFSLTTQ